MCDQNLRSIDRTQLSSDVQWGLVKRPRLCIHLGSAFDQEFCNFRLIAFRGIVERRALDYIACFDRIPVLFQDLANPPHISTLGGPI
jgi:hypothetical protein